MSFVGYWKPPLRESWPRLGWVFIVVSVALMLGAGGLAQLSGFPRVVCIGLCAGGASSLLHTLGVFQWRRRHWTNTYTEPFCIYCGYTQMGLPEMQHNCPECGNLFSKEAWRMYVADPVKYAKKHPPGRGNAKPED